MKTELVGNEEWHLHCNMQSFAPSIRWRPLNENLFAQSHKTWLGQKRKQIILPFTNEKHSTTKQHDTQVPKILFPISWHCKRSRFKMIVLVFLKSATTSNNEFDPFGMITSDIKSVKELRKVNRSQSTAVLWAHNVENLVNFRTTRGSLWFFVPLSYFHWNKQPPSALLLLYIYWWMLALSFWQTSLSFFVSQQKTH